MAMDTELISLVNKLQDTFSNLGMSGWPCCNLLNVLTHVLNRRRAGHASDSGGMLLMILFAHMLKVIIGQCRSGASLRESLVY